MLESRVSFVALLCVFALLARPGAVHAQSSRPGRGATPYHDAAGTGVTFRVWAPHAASVTVPGEFNGWSTTATPLHHDLVDGAWNGEWSADVPAARPGRQYKFFVTANGKGLWRHDPRARKCTVSGAAGNDVVVDPTAFDWGDDAPVTPPADDLVIYELHVGTYGAGAGANCFAGAAARLDHLVALGVSAIELLPVAEFPGTDSWGYNPAQPFAVENAAYGGPDGMKAFVRACHQRGIAVLLDVVHNHYGPGDLDLWEFDGWQGPGTRGGGIYFARDPSSFQETPWGDTRPNTTSQPVRDYIRDNLRMWIDEYHVDGFRWDATDTLLHGNDGTYIAAAGSLLSEINAMIHASGAKRLSIAEDTFGAFGFDGAWDTSFPYAVRPVLASPDATRDLSPLASALGANVRYGGTAGYTRVAFLESHDVAGDLNQGTRLPAVIDPASPESWRARKLSMLGTTLAFASPGIPMLLQGQEALETRPFSSGRAVDWTRTNTQPGVVAFHRDLIRLRRDLAGLAPGLRGDRFSVLRRDDSRKVLVTRRWKSSDASSDVVVVANLSGAALLHYPVPFPRQGPWHVHLNTDATRYGADFSGIGSEGVTPGTAGDGIDIGPYSVQVLSLQPPAPTLAIRGDGGALVLAWPANFARWVLETSKDPVVPSSWTAVSQATVTGAGGEASVQVAPSATAFYRLRAP